MFKQKYQEKKNIENSSKKLTFYKNQITHHTFILHRLKALGHTQGPPFLCFLIFDLVYSLNRVLSKWFFGGGTILREKKHHHGMSSYILSKVSF